VALPANGMASWLDAQTAHQDIHNTCPDEIMVEAYSQRSSYDSEPQFRSPVTGLT
jgi:hypothetical protein